MKEEFQNDVERKCEQKTKDVINEIEKKYKKEESRIELHDGITLVTSTVPGASGEPLKNYQYFLSPEAVKLMLNPEPLLKLSASHGLETDDVITVVDFLVGVLGKSNPYVALASAAYLEFDLMNRLDFLPKIENELEKCEAGDYVTVTSSYGIGTWLNYSVRHTEGNTVYPYNPENYEVEKLGAGDIW